ncbi:MAG TPA: CoA pyrophosphatase [Candidatus Methylomirabilis sp.]|nr:CoA pyrophosphatase [Candidatus Methylomirabilis sp.]
MGSEPVGLKDRVASVLGGRIALQAAPDGFRRAAVLLPLYETEAGPHLVLTKRTESVPTHKGQISFPGGGFEEADGDLCATALREAEEEIGLRPQDVQVVGALDDTLTASTRHVVRPFVGMVPHPYPFRLDAFEIESLIHLPIRELLCGAPFREEMWERDGLRYPVYFYEHEGRTIWGLTARILKQFVEVVGPTLCEASPSGTRDGNRTVADDHGSRG